MCAKGCGSKNSRESLRKCGKVLPVPVWCFWRRSDDALVQRFSRSLARPHPMGRSHTVLRSFKGRTEAAGPDS